ncbi:MAG: PEP-CTERM sorting domain-containing protein [Armatimonadetes bacterium]|nr:PEP-CTERM sorting domain-containing protein [Akkermansiaceae bacterium]
MKILYKQTIIPLSVFAASLFLQNAAQAVNVIPNSNFSNGYNSFTSSYIQVTTQNPTSGPGMRDEGGYTVLANPVTAHDSWQPIPAGSPYNTVNGEMLVLNGSSSALTVWQTSAVVVTNPLQDYFFQAAVTNLFAPNVAATNGAILSFQYSEESSPTVWITLGTVDLATTISGQWQVTPGTSAFTIENPSENIFLRIVNAQTEANGNDFAIGLVSLDTTAVPEPAAAMLGGIGFLALLRRRRN